MLRQTARKKLRAKLKEVKTELRRRLHAPVPEVGKWLGSILRGHYNRIMHPFPDQRLVLQT